MVLKKSLFRVLNKFIREKENYINAEAIVNEKEWEKLKKLVGKGFSWFIPTPTNYDYCKNVFNLKIEKNKFTTILKSRINFLKEKNEKIYLSIHFGKVRKFLENDSQEKKLKEAIEFLNSIEIKPSKFIILDEVYNRETISIAIKYGLKNLLNFRLYIINPLLKIIDFLHIKMSFIREIYLNFKKNKVKNIFHLIIGEFRDVKEKTLHVEAIVRDD